MSVDDGRTYTRLPFETSTDFTRKFACRILPIGAYVRGNGAFRIRLEATNESGETRLVLCALMLSGDVR